MDGWSTALRVTINWIIYNQSLIIIIISSYKQKTKQDDHLSGKLVYYIVDTETMDGWSTAHRVPINWIIYS
jgi:hypothetical protein